MKNFLIFFGVLILLYIGRSLFTPLLLALFLWYLTNSIRTYYRKVMPDKKLIKNENKIISDLFDWVAFILSVVTVAAFIFLFIKNIQPMFAELIARLPELQAKLTQLISYMSKNLGLTLNASMLQNVMPAITNIGMGAANLAVTFGMVIVYLLFIFIEQSTFSKKFAALFPDKRHFKKISFILQSIDESMKRYLFIKTALSAATAIVSYFWLEYLGLEFAAVWAFIIFITNYIPTFGAIIACALPILYAFVATGGASLPVLVGVGLITLQIVFGNLMEPKLIGKTLNLSTLAILINLVFWGMLWGPIGMFFSVPLLVAILVATAQFDSTRWIAVLLSAKGKIPEKED